MSLKFSCIYKLTNRKNNKIYVGKTTNYGHRMGQYRTAFRSPNIDAQTKWIADLKHETETGVIDFNSLFKQEVLERVDPEHLDEREIYWIDKLDARNPAVGYNIAAGGSLYDNSVSVNRYRIKLGGECKRHITTIYDMIDNSIAVYFTLGAAARDVGIDKDSAAEITRRAVEVQSRYLLIRFNRDDRLKIFRTYTSKQFKKMKQYSKLRANRNDLQAHVARMANRIVRYCDAVIAVEKYSYEVDYRDKAYFDSVLREYENVKKSASDFILPTHRQEVASKRREFTKAVIENGIILKDQNFNKNHIPVILFDKTTKKLYPFGEVKLAAKYLGVSQDQLRSRLEWGTVISEKYFAYYANNDRREKVARKLHEGNRHKRKTSEVKSDTYLYYVGYFMVRKYCENNAIDFNC